MAFHKIKEFYTEMLSVFPPETQKSHNHHI
jgi:hypothetical protein